MNLHSKYTDYKIIYKYQQFERLEHITDSNRTIIISYYESGQIYQERWLLNDKWHREDSPAKIEYYESGKIKQEQWVLNDKWHREDGPAYIEYDESGNITNQEFYLNDRQYTYTKFIQTPEYQASLKQQLQDIFD